NLRLDETSSLLRLLGSVEGDEEELTTVYVPPEDEIDDVFGSASGKARRSFEDFDKDTVGLLRKASESESTVVVFDSKGVVRVCLTPPREVERSSVEMGSEFVLDRTAKPTA
ncbi:MAG: hypothetical protein SV760_09000, partial [Halobacteria archaeon]|nr:hypothetical protein [Halobacteria archaeon]